MLLVKSPKNITFAHFFILTTIFSNNKHGQGYRPCLQTHPEQLEPSTPPTQHFLYHHNLCPHQNMMSLMIVV